jgi:Amino acid permease
MKLIPCSYRRYLSFITGGLYYLSYQNPVLTLMLGWLCAITWQAAACGAVYFTATMTQGLIILNHPDTYVPKQWHGTLLMFAFLTFAIVFNTFLAKRLPLLEGMFVILHVLGVLIFIPLWVLSPIQQGGSSLTEFYNPGGWSSNGVATLVGALAPVTALIGFDCSVHMGMLLF